MNVLDTDLLLDMVDRKHQVLAELCELSRRQMAMIDRQDMSPLLELLSAKQELLTRLQVIERQLDPFRGQSPDERQWRTAASRSRCSQLLDRCETLLAEIVDREKQSETQLRTYRDEIGARLTGAHSAGRARHAYAAQQAMHVSQLDLTSEN
jgi:hypothetical protein